MAQIARLTLRQIGSQYFKNDKCGYLSIVRPVTLQPKPYQPPEQEGHDEHNMKLGRPQSPHLTIYAPQITSMLSISHRFTGMALAGYAVILGTGAIVADIPAALDNFHPGVACITSIKFLLAFPTCYHFWNGIRHLLWDTGKFLTIKEVYSTGYVMLGVSFVSTIALLAL